MARHRQAPGCVRIRVAVRAPPRASPPVAPASPAGGHFVCANPSAAVPPGASPGTRPHAHSYRYACPRARPLPLHRPAPLRVIPLARAHPRRSRSHIPPPSGAPGIAFSRLSAASPGNAFPRVSATGLGLGNAGISPETSINLS